MVQVEKRRLSEERVVTDLDLACGSILLYTAVFVYRVVTGMSCVLATGWMAFQDSILMCHAVWLVTYMYECYNTQ